MPILLFSDSHGSTNALLELQKRVDEISPSQLILLGDSLYRGNNHFLSGYSTNTAADILNSWKDKIIAVRGNCDFESEQALLDFSIMQEMRLFTCNNLRFFLHHGHIWNKENLPKRTDIDIFAYGHTHSPLLEKTPDGLILLNPGAIDWPRRNYPASFAIIKNNKIEIKALKDPEKIIYEMIIE